jgi:diguanylate cyclase (GGDEF)-like protein
MGRPRAYFVRQRHLATGAFYVQAALLVLLFLLSCRPAPAQERWTSLADVDFRLYTQDDGLPNPICTAMAEDSDGFLWIGTEGGLTRWDGYRFHSYLPDSHVAGTLHDNWIVVLHTDPRGRLWIGTSAAGLARYDRAHDNFITYPIEPGGLSSVSINAIADDGNGKLWIASDDMLAHFDPDSGKVTALHHQPGNPASLPAGKISWVKRDAVGNLWVGTSKGLSRRPPGSETFVAVPLPGAPAETTISALFEDQDGRIWIGTNGHGAYVIETPQDAPQPVHETGPAGDQLSSQWVWTIAAAEPGKIWLGTYGQGIVAVDAASKQTVRIRHDPFLPRTLANDTIWVLHRDRSGAMWVGTTDGLSRQESVSGALLSVFGASNKPSGISEGDILSVLPMSDGNVWLGLRTKGIDIMDPVRGRIKTITPSAKDPEHALPKAFLWNMAELANGSIYLSTYKGLYRTDRTGNAVQRVEVPGREPGLGVTDVLQADGRLWIAGNEDGLWSIGQDGGSSQPTEHFDAKVLTDPRVSTLALGREGDMWIGTRNGLNRLDLATRELEKIPAAPTVNGGLSAGFISSLMIDQAGRLWVATLGGGIDVLVGRRQGQPIFHTIGTADGLPDSNVDTLLADRRGRIWAATDSGLAVIDPDNFTVHSLHRADGVAVSAYWTGSGAVTQQGDLLFGGVGALTVVRPERYQPWDYHPPVVVTELRVGDQPVQAAGFNDADTQTSLKVTPDANSFSVEFASLDFTAPEQNKYAYWLEGYDRDWIAVESTRRLAAYTNLPPGSYTLHLRGSNRDGVWSQAVLHLPVIVQPAWYQTIWCRIAEAVTVAGIGLLLVQRRTANLRQRQRELERQVAERTAELEQSKRQIELIAYQDALTGLPNRRMFIADFQKHLVLESRRAGRFALLLIDLDHFKQINDTLGHDAGDAMLVEAASRLQSAVRHSDCLARLGGDEFAILLTDTVDMAAAEAICLRIVDSFIAPIPFNGIEMRTSPSIGMALYPAHGTNQDTLYKAADLALYDAKAAGRNTWRWHDPTTEGLADTRALQPIR